VSSRSRVLFVCGRARARSFSAARIFARDPRFAVRAAGVHASAARVVSANDIAWASAICVMERAQQRALEERFRDELRGKRLHVLDIPDEYAPLDPELVELLRTSVPALLGFD
jgi:predicted protein tyrosine phosphatase